LADALPHGFNAREKMAIVGERLRGRRHHFTEATLDIWCHDAPNPNSLNATIENGGS